MEELYYYKKDFMLFSEQGSPDFREVVREEPGSHVYYVYEYCALKYPTRALVFRARIDLEQYDKEDLANWLSNWGYRSYEEFMEYMDNHTELHNYELRVADAVFVYDEILYKDEIVDDTMAACLSRISQVIGGRDPHDDSEIDPIAVPDKSVF